MRKGEFDLTGKAIDCSGLPSLGDAGKEIFRALKVACNGGEHPPFSVWSNVTPHRGVYLIINGAFKMLATTSSVQLMNLKKIKPSGVLGQAAIDAAMDGATIVFEGDVIPASYRKMYFFDSGYGINDSDEVFIAGNNVVAYKVLKPIARFTESPKSFVIHKVLTDGEICNVSSLMDEGLNQEEIIEKLGLSRESKAYCPPSIESRILSEKVGSPSVYDDLWDAHLELIQENMALTLELETANLKIKNLHRAINDAKAAIDV